MSRHPRRSDAEWLGLHGLVLGARDPRALAARLRRLLGWSTLSTSRSEIVLGTGPEMFLAIRRDSNAGGRICLREVHVALRGMSRRLRVRADALGGDSWSESVGEELSITAREFRRPPRGRWRRPRRPH